MPVCEGDDGSCIRLLWAEQTVAPDWYHSVWSNEMDLSAPNLLQQLKFQLRFHWVLNVCAATLGVLELQQDGSSLKSVLICKRSSQFPAYRVIKLDLWTVWTTTSTQYTQFQLDLTGVKSAPQGGSQPDGWTDCDLDFHTVSFLKTVWPYRCLVPTCESWHLSALTCPSGSCTTVPPCGQSSRVSTINSWTVRRSEAIPTVCWWWSYCNTGVPQIKLRSVNMLDAP